MPEPDENIPKAVLSHYQATEMTLARSNRKDTVTTSLDLGLSTVRLPLDRNGVKVDDLGLISWKKVEKIRKSRNSCFLVTRDGVEKISRYSDFSQQPYSLMPTQTAPTMLVAGKTMHRIKRSDPVSDTLAKIAAVKPVTGRVLDTTTGLGYTAIQAARTASEVITVEVDPSAAEIAGLNPWSADLFRHPRIRRIMGDCFDIMDQFKDAEFDCILHDPPSMQLAGRLYSGECYAKIYRILKKRGRLFHYIGNPDSAFGNKITEGVIRRLKETGLVNLSRKPDAFGVVAVKK